MEAQALSRPTGSITSAENWFALGAGALLLFLGASRRSFFGSCLALSSTALLYRGVTGRWPRVVDGSLESDDTKAALGGSTSASPSVWNFRSPTSTVSDGGSKISHASCT